MTALEHSIETDHRRARRWRLELLVLSLFTSLGAGVGYTWYESSAAVPSKPVSFTTVALLTQNAALEADLSMICSDPLADTRCSVFIVFPSPPVTPVAWALLLGPGIEALGKPVIQAKAGTPGATFSPPSGTEFATQVWGGVFITGTTALGTPQENIYGPHPTPATAFHPTDAVLPNDETTISQGYTGLGEPYLIVHVKLDSPLEVQTNGIASGSGPTIGMPRASDPTGNYTILGYPGTWFAPSSPKYTTQISIGPEISDNANVNVSPPLMDRTRLAWSQDTPYSPHWSIADPQQEESARRLAFFAGGAFALAVSAFLALCQLLIRGYRSRTPLHS